MVAATAGPASHNPFHSFHISVNGRRISDNKHPLYGRAEQIKTHAWKGKSANDHQIEKKVNCHGVAKDIDILVNKLIIPNCPLAKNNQRLADIIGGEKAQAFISAVQNNGSVTWNIIQITADGSARLTLSVPITNLDQTQLALFGAHDESAKNSLSLSLDSNKHNIVLTIDYNDTQFLKDPGKTPLVGDLCQDIIWQVNHAIREERPPPNAGDIPAGSAAGNSSSNYDEKTTAAAGVLPNRSVKVGGAPIANQEESITKLKKLLITVPKNKTNNEWIEYLTNQLNGLEKDLENLRKLRTSQDKARKGLTPSGRALQEILVI